MEMYYEKILPNENFLSRVYMWMTGALIITTCSAYFVSTNSSLYYTLMSNPFLLPALLLGQLALVGTLSIGINKLSYPAALTIFLIYSLINGITLSPITKIYTDASIALTFATTAAMFGIMALYGYFTRADLSKLGSIFIMMLFGLIFGFLINLYFQSSAMDFILSAAGVIIFCGLTAYDMQKLKNLSSSAFEDMDSFNKLTLLGALTLYLDVINLFLNLLRFMGKQRK